METQSQKADSSIALRGTISPSDSALSSPGKNDKANYRKVVWTVYVLLALGLVATVAWSDLRCAMTALIWALACFVSGSALGFIFGIPKVLQQGAHKPADDSKTNVTTPAQAATYRQEVNTNLTDISDWLTKIIVGVGLVNLKELPPLIKKLALVLANGLAKCDPGRDYLAYSVAVIVFFLTLGFLFGYLMMRLYLAAEFARADLGVLALSQTLLKGDLAPIETAISLLKDAQVRTASEAEIADGAKSTITKAAESQSPEEQALAAAQRSLDANSISDEKERVKIKDSCANEVAELIVREKLTKDWIVEQVPVQTVYRRQDALISGLAIAITVSPEAQDFPRLLRVALSCQWPNAQHKVCIAMSKLFSAGIAKKEDVPDAVRILNDFLHRGADEALKRRIFETAAVISRSTGVSINLPQ